MSAVVLRLLGELRDDDGGRGHRDGAPHHLSDFKGRGMVVNMWATWCAPCGAEMPSLQQLSKARAPHDIAVLPLSSDRGTVADTKAAGTGNSCSGKC